VLDLAAADDIPDADIVGRIKEGHGRAGFPHEAGKIGGVTRIAAEEAVVTGGRQGARNGLNGKRPGPSTRQATGLRPEYRQCLL
jgi:hypothetical protein